MEKVELDFVRTLSDRNSVYYECVSDNDLSSEYYRASEVDAKISELEAENDRLRKALKTAFNHVCKFDDCRRMSGKVSDGYCYVHQQIYSVLEAPNAKDS